MTHYIIEGIDRLGKSTLIENIQNELGFFHVMHYSKPKKLWSFGGSQQNFQDASFRAGFDLLPNVQPRFIFDRFHLGEYVYAPYRGYTGDYVFDLEKTYGVHSWSQVRLILLYTERPDVLQDDGLSIAYEKRAEEQDRFIEAFNHSIFPDKRMINVMDQDGNFRDKTSILFDAIGS